MTTPMAPTTSGTDGRGVSRSRARLIGYLAAAWFGVALVLEVALPDSEVNVGGGMTFHGSMGSAVLAVGLLVAVIAGVGVGVRARRRHG